MEYLKFETHCHTGDVSACGRVPAAEMVALYKAAGYSGLCITDHINPFTFGPELDTWEKKSRYFLQGYRNAKAAAGDDFDVLLGGEFHFHENNNDYLVYGMTEELVEKELDNDILDWGIKRFSDFCRANGLLLIQAHPFRNSMQINSPGTVDGIEVLNCHPRHDSRNFIAELWANRFGLLKTSGSDAHQPDDVGTGGIYVPQRLRTLDDLVREIRSGAKLIRPAGAV